MTLKTPPIDPKPPLRGLRRLARGAAALGVVGLLLGGCAVAPPCDDPSPAVRQ